MTFKVMEEKCDECLFSKDKIVSDTRRKQLLEEIAADDSYFVCHKASIAGDKSVCCRGFYDTQSKQLIQVAQRLNLVEFVKEENL